MTNSVYKCGYVAIVGRPNVGKSTLLNHSLGQKLSITSRKPQTTRHQILGVKTLENHQIVYVDTPGLHKKNDNAINRYMNRAASSVVSDVDLVLFVVQAPNFTEGDEEALKHLSKTSSPVILVINKIDLLDDKKKLLPFMEKVSALYKFSDIIPVSALKGKGLEKLEKLVTSNLPDGEAIFPDDQITDRSMRFLAAEIIREKLIRELGQELPYTTTVDIEKYNEEDDLVSIFATIYVESKGQKSIIIGKKGSRLKSIGSKARKDIEGMVDTKVFIQLWVKIREGWSNDEQALRGLGYSLD